MTNNGSATYNIFAPDDHNNCLSVTDDAGRFIPTFPEGTCDVLAEIILRPGQTIYLGSWDLRRCDTIDCQERYPAPPGTYHFSVTAHVYDPTSATLSETSFTREASVVVQATAD